MKLKHSVLWIEDGARYDLATLPAPLYLNDYDLVVAENASDGIARLKNPFEIIIVDIRIPPVDPAKPKLSEYDKKWLSLYAESGKHKVAARLGRDLLYTILAHPEARIKRPDGLEWVRPDMIGVLTVEGYPEIREDLEKLGIVAYSQKGAGTTDTLLLDLVEKVVDQQKQQAQTEEGG